MVTDTTLYKFGNAQRSNYGFLGISNCTCSAASFFTDPDDIHTFSAPPIAQAVSELLNLRAVVKGYLQPDGTVYYVKEVPFKSYIREHYPEYLI